MNTPWEAPIGATPQQEEISFERRFPRRLGLMALAAGLLALAIVLRLVLLLLSPTRETLLKMVEQKRVVYQGAEPRGLILDAAGHVLAGTRLRYEVSVDQTRIPDKAAFAAQVAPLLSLSTQEVLQKFQQANGATWVLLAMDVSAEQAARLRQEFPNRPWFSLTEVPVRDYPEGSLASNVLGFVQAAEQRGTLGVEQHYDALLAPPERVRSFPIDPALAEALDEPPHERVVVLTIRRALQADVESLLDRYVREQEAAGGAVVVLDVHTGAVLAMASSPRPDLRDYDETVHYAMQPHGGFNRAIDSPYEPGSVFKVLVMAAALDAGVVDQSTVYNDVGLESAFNGPPVRNSDYKARGQVSMQACLQYSLNTCLAWVAKQFPSAQTFYTYLQAFGIGQYTGIDLAGERPGLLPRPGMAQWSRSDWVRQGFGQAVSVTPLQMAVAAAAVANGGYLMTPYVVQEIRVDGYVYHHDPEVVRQVISEKTARLMSRWLVPWDDSWAVKGRVPGYTIAGKTGTGEIPVKGQGYTSRLTNASFVGWFPVDDPQVVVYVWLEHPKGYWGSQTAAPLFREVAERVAVHLGIPPDRIRRTLAQEQP